MLEEDEGWVHLKCMHSSECYTSQGDDLSNEEKGNRVIKRKRKYAFRLPFLCSILEVLIIILNHLCHASMQAESDTTEEEI